MDEFLFLTYVLYDLFSVEEGDDDGVIDPAVEIHEDEVTTLTGHESEVFVVHWNPKVYILS